MTGRHLRKSGVLKGAILLAMGVALAGCDENGEFSFGGGDGADDTAAVSSGVPVQTETVEGDVERPDIFEVTDRGLWDGRPSLGGAWVAHPDVKEPERALIRNTATGETIIGALFRRERENPGPLLQISSDVAEELDVLPGAPTELYVVVLRRVEVTEPAEAPEVAENPVVADLAAPVNVESTALAPVEETAEAATAAAATVATAAAGAAVATAEAATPDRVEVPPAAPVEEAVEAVAALPTPAAQMANLDGPQLQIGVFSVEENANGAANQLRGANIPTSVIAQQAGGRIVWRVVSSPAEATDAETTLTRIKDLGFVDAFLVEQES